MKIIFIFFCVVFAAQDKINDFEEAGKLMQSEAEVIDSIILERVDILEKEKNEDMTELEKNYKQKEKIKQNLDSAKDQAIEELREYVKLSDEALAYHKRNIEEFKTQAEVNEAEDDKFLKMSPEEMQEYVRSHYS